MPTKAKKKNTRPQPVSSHMTVEPSIGNSTSPEEIRFRAYEIYLERGEQSGHDVEDWLQAERELQHRAG